MGKIFYSLSGEGRGHAARARTLLDDLEKNHEISVYAPANAYDMLEPLYRHSDNIKVHKIPGLMFHYNDKQRLDYGITIFKSLEYFLDSTSLVKKLCIDIDKEKPDLIITDFEPSLPRAAEKCNIPYISVNHQHFLQAYDLSSLPPVLQQRAAFIGQSLNFFYQKQIKTIVSAFYFPPLRPSLKNVIQVGVFLNKKIRAMMTSDDGHIVVYLRRFIDKDLIRILTKLNRRVIVYNDQNDNERTGNVEFKKISPHTFLEDLSSCSCLISTAGNQLVGEAMYLGKPVFAIPEPDNFEQEINGHFLTRSGAGIDYLMEEVNIENLKFFLSNLNMYKSRIDREKMAGNVTTCREINRILGIDADNSEAVLAVS